MTEYSAGRLRQLAAMARNYAEKESLYRAHRQRSLLSAMTCGALEEAETALDTLQNELFDVLRDSPGLLARVFTAAEKTEEANA